MSDTTPPQSLTASAAALARSRAAARSFEDAQSLRGSARDAHMRKHLARFAPRLGPVSR